ncbi:hypothetical protein [Hyphomicrobium sp.]|uniref:hypothetical protein n=1 Tax=Hyphomicrobium sp. TaxID=82 RepID=UPI000F9541FC|nr:hypothetical protein [Hyphomicrobium sp.]RUP11120.1 MAG: hypothetical protein EKK38_01295 [Hyphomicrobium sp.]
MINIDEMKKRILGTLEEAGNECVISLLPDVIDPTGDRRELEILTRSLRELLSEGSISIRMTSLPHGRQPLSAVDGLAEIDKLSSNYIFNTHERCWEDSRSEGPPYFQIPEPEVVLTKTGREKSVALLEKLGHEWWR